MSLAISTDKSKLDMTFIHAFLNRDSTWAKGISFDLVKTSIEHSLCFGLYLFNQQIGFARVISDYATFANLVDVFVIPQHRGNGYSKKLMQAVVNHPDLQGLRRFTLATLDAHGLNAQYGFTALHKPETFMEILDSDIYKKD